MPLAYFYKGFENHHVTFFPLRIFQHTHWDYPNNNPNIPSPWMTMWQIVTNDLFLYQICKLQPFINIHITRSWPIAEWVIGKFLMPKTGVITHKFSITFFLIRNNQLLSIRWFGIVTNILTSICYHECFISFWRRKSTPLHALLKSTVLSTQKG